MMKVKHFLFKSIIQIWKITPFKVALSKLIKKNTKIKEKLYQDLRFKGNMDIKVGESNFVLFNPGFTTIENELFWNGLNNWEKISLGIWCEFVKSSNVILDIGANTGIYSLIAASINPVAQVFSFEPVKRTSKLLKKNIELNPKFNITLIEKAVSNKDGMATFYDLPTDSQYSATLNESMLADYSNRISYDVETISLDNLNDLKNKKIDLIKLDVEMHEPEAILGMIEIIKKDHPLMLVEILTAEIANRIQSIFDNINPEGYLFFNIDEENKPSQIESLKKSDFYNVLIVPKNKLEQVIHVVNFDGSIDMNGSSISNLV